jgi:hypothetical protein
MEASLRSAPLATRGLAASLAALASAALARSAHGSLRAGTPRLSAVAPLIALFIALPVRH